MAVRREEEPKTAYCGEVNSEIELKNRINKIDKINKKYYHKIIKNNEGLG